MSKKHDPPNKDKLMASFRRTPSTTELMVAAAEAQFPSKVESEDDASRAKQPKDCTIAPPPLKRGRKPIVTPERVRVICEALSNGDSESLACMRAGISLTTWNKAKRADQGLRLRIESAREEWARLRHAQRAAALYESQAMRAANRKALKPQPTYQAKLVVRHLTVRLPLHFAAIPEAEIVSACERFSIPLETWRRQERAFHLMKKVYTRRAEIRGDQVASGRTNIDVINAEWPDAHPSGSCGY